MKLSALLTGLTASLTIPALEISRITERADQAAPDSIFVCIKGAVADGHDFAKAAYDNGCRVFVVEQPVTLPEDAAVFTVESTRATLAALACRFYQNPSHAMHLIGVTGTKGKTTTAQLLAHILNAADIPCGYIGTNGISYADRQIKTNNTTPDAITLQATLAEMQRAGVLTAVIEVSSQALMQFRVDGTRFQTVLFTNLTPDHIGPREHASFEQYKACKKRLFTDFEATSVIFNADDPTATELLQDTSANAQISCSQSDARADFLASKTTLCRENGRLGVSFDLKAGGLAIPSVYLPLIGRVNVANALLALATAVSVFHVPLKAASEHLQTATVAGRSELIPLPLGASAVIDYAHTGESLSHLLSTLREYQPARLIVLFGSIGERAQMRRIELGRAAATHADLAIITSDNPNFEDPMRIISEIAATFADTNTPHLEIPDRREAILAAASMLRAGDVLVLAGKGHERDQLINGQSVPFCERDILLEATANLVRS